MVPWPKFGEMMRSNSTIQIPRSEMNTNQDHTDGTTRRSLLKSIGAGLAMGLTAGNYSALAGAGPNDRIRIGSIGVGGMGIGRLREFMKQPDVTVAAICDVDQSHLDRALGEAEKQQGQRPQGFRDFRKLLELKDLDAVVVATPDHWHALPTIKAFRAGKDVFVEKPLSYSIGEGRAMVRAAQSNKRVSQMGNHIHNDLPNYRRVVEIVRSGMLGKISRVTCWKTSSLSSKLGNPPDCPPPAELDYDFWLGPAPKRPYNPNRSHGSFRYFWDYSGGVFIDFWAHITDVAYWALDLKAPKSVSSIGGRFFADDNTEAPDTLDLLYEFPNLDLTWTLNPMGFPGYEHMGGIGCIFQGTDATLVTNYQTHELYVKGKQVTEFKRPEPSIPDSPGHIREFLDAVKSRERTTCDVEYAHRLTKGGLLGNMAFRLGRRLYWDDAHERVIGDSVAGRMVTRRYRKPWKLT
jgi:predicted dehydrogenase